MSFLNSQSKTNEEGCGKWLTTKGKSNPKSCVKQNQKQPLSKKTLCLSVSNTTSCIKRTFTPVTLPVLPDKLCKMKQSKINTFLVNKPKQCNSSVPHSSKLEVPVTLPMKRDMSVAPNEYAKLWGSDGESEDNESYQALSKTEKNTETILRRGVCSTMTQVSKAATTYNCSTRSMRLEMENETSTCDNKERGEVLPSSKKFKKSDNDAVCLDASFKPPFYSKSNQFQFTQWFQEQVDEFCRNSCEVNERELVKEILSSVPYCDLLSPDTIQSHSLQESQRMVQFTDWFNQQIETFDSEGNSLMVGELSENCSLPSSGSYKQGFAFTQWFEENSETFIRCHNSKS